MLPANTMYIIDEDCAATSMTFGGDDGRRIAYMKRGYFFHRASRSSKSGVQFSLTTRKRVLTTSVSFHPLPQLSAALTRWSRLTPNNALQHATGNNRRVYPGTRGAIHWARGHYRLPPACGRYSRRAYRAHELFCSLIEKDKRYRFYGSTNSRRGSLF
jgi:hypothetical protein